MIKLNTHRMLINLARKSCKIKGLGVNRKVLRELKSRGGPPHAAARKFAGEVLHQLQKIFKNLIDIRSVFNI